MKVRNLTKTSLELRSADGDSVLLMPGSIVEIEEKFKWQLNPQTVKIIIDKEEPKVVVEIKPVPKMPVSTDKGEDQETLASREASRGNTSSTTKANTVRT